MTANEFQFFRRIRTELRSEISTKSVGNFATQILIYPHGYWSKSGLTDVRYCALRVTSCLVVLPYLTFWGSLGPNANPQAVMLQKSPTDILRYSLGFIPHMGTMSARPLNRGSAAKFVVGCGKYSRGSQSRGVAWRHNDVICRWPGVRRARVISRVQAAAATAAAVFDGHWYTQDSWLHATVGLPPCSSSSSSLATHQQLHRPLSALERRQAFGLIVAKAVLLSRPFLRSRDQDRDLDKMNSSALESRDHGLEITTLRKSASFSNESADKFCSTIDR